LMSSTIGLFFIPLLYFVIQSAAYLVARNRQAILGGPPREPIPQGGHH